MFLLLRSIFASSRSDTLRRFLLALGSPVVRVLHPRPNRMPSFLILWRSVLGIDPQYLRSAAGAVYPAVCHGEGPSDMPGIHFIQVHVLASIWRADVMCGFEDGATSPENSRGLPLLRMTARSTTLSSSLTLPGQ